MLDCRPDVQLVFLQGFIPFDQSHVLPALFLVKFDCVLQFLCCLVGSERSLLKLKSRVLKLFGAAVITVGEVLALCSLLLEQAFGLL